MKTWQKNIFVGIIRRLHVVVARKNVNFRGPVVLMLFLIPMKSLLKDTFNTFKAKLEWLTILNTDQLLTYMAHTILIGHGLWSPVKRQVHFTLNSVIITLVKTITKYELEDQMVWYIETSSVLFATKLQTIHILITCFMAANTTLRPHYLIEIIVTLVYSIKVIHSNYQQWGLWSI